MDLERTPVSVVTPILCLCFFCRRFSMVLDGKEKRIFALLFFLFLPPVAERRKTPVCKLPSIWRLTCVRTGRRWDQQACLPLNISFSLTLSVPFSFLFFLFLFFVLGTFFSTTFPPIFVPLFTSRRTSACGRNGGACCAPCLLLVKEEEEKNVRGPAYLLYLVCFVFFYFCYCYYFSDRTGH